jgi:hypothetical protein
MRGNSHVRFGGRAEETERPKGRHRASVRPNRAGNTWAADSGANLRANSWSRWGSTALGRR